MITDRITLNLALIYLNIIDSNIGSVSNIKVSSRSHYSNSGKNINSFGSLNDLRNYINSEAPLSTPMRMQCHPLSIYELKGFKIKGEKQNITITSNGSSFDVRGDISSIITTKLNEYSSKFSNVKRVFTELDPTKYISSQGGYVDCMYIQMYFGDALEEVKKLYIKYK